MVLDLVGLFKLSILFMNSFRLITIIILFFSQVLLALLKIKYFKTSGFNLL